MNNYLENENDLSYNASRSPTSSAAQTPPFRMFQETGAPAAVHALQSAPATTNEGCADNDTNGNDNSHNNKSEKEKEDDHESEKFQH